MIIFSYLLNNREKIVTRDELMTDLWNNEEYINDNALTVNISRLRNKLSEVGYDKAIETRNPVVSTVKFRAWEIISGGVMIAINIAKRCCRPAKTASLNGGLSSI